MRAEDLWDYIIPEPNSGCWLWTLSLQERDYGQVNIDGKIRRAHRVAWELTHGTLPRDRCVLHRCDVRQCLNPEHLFLGSPADNSRDMVTRQRSQAGEGHHRAKLTEAVVSEIRALRGVISQRNLSQRFHVTQSTISLIQTGQAWNHSHA